jgi:acyl dehydratase
MAFSAERLLAHTFAPVRHTYAARDVILYALGVGLGQDPLKETDLAFLLEDRLAPLPTFAVTLGSPGLWVKAPELEIDWVRLVHAGQEALFHAPLPPNGDVVGESRIREVADRGAHAGAVVVVERRIKDARTDAPLCTLAQTLLLRGNGGFGGQAPLRARESAPDSPPDFETHASTSSRAALIYRLSGDMNPLHADPSVAARAGFERPILHGLASYGLAGVTVARALGRSPAEIASLSTRFAGVVYPGDTLTFSIWRTENGALFRARCGERMALDGGVMSFRI